MTISARNQLVAHISAIRTGATNDVIEMELKTGEKLTAVITAESTANLGLDINTEVLAIFKAPSVILSTDNSLIFSSRNQFKGKVEQITHGAVNAEIIIKTYLGTRFTAIITETSANNMALQIGTDVTALIKASSVILAVKA
ncbi:MAG: TOBE domain-containing protein [Pasteurellaceae bacterium]|nr:TOBE domain-containing protein [Pasteurellaceae bacterium]